MSVDLESVCDSFMVDRWGPVRGESYSDTGGKIDACIIERTVSN